MPHSLDTATATRHLHRVRKNAPLVHVMTNDVVTGFTANVLLALGAAPAMITAPEEAGDFARMAAALSVNAGTLTRHQADAMRIAIDSANAHGVPWVLDPVAAGVLEFRTRLCQEWMMRRPAAIRGNASEIMALAGSRSGGRGVDSLNASDEAISSAVHLARQCGTLVAVTGETDFVTDGSRTLGIKAGHPLMTRVTGTGCALSAVAAAFMADAGDRLEALASACAVMAVAGQQAAQSARGPGSFVADFLDALYTLDEADLAKVLP